ncbi:MAG TPA: hypothetical protein DDW27_21920 [Bacteroidales bacterium]|nr:hypothetical protein [Bacteroidales bacterium]
MARIYIKQPGRICSVLFFAVMFIYSHVCIDKLSAQVPDNAVLLPGTYEIDTITIRARIRLVDPVARPYTEPVSLFPTISRLSHTDIRKQGAVTLIDAMNFIPGGFTETRGRQVKQFFSVRGQKYPYPDYAVNGVWQKEFEELPYFFSASDIEEIEVIRSSAALLTGLSGLAGLINIKTREYTDFETRVDLEYGSLNSLHSHISTGNRIGNFSYAAGLGHDRSDGPEGRHAKEAMTNLYTRMNWQISDKLGVNTSLFYLNGERELALALPPAEKRYQDMIQGFDPYNALLTNMKMTYRPSPKLSSELQVFYSQRNPTFYDEVAETTSNEKDYEYGFNFIQSVRVMPSNVLRFGGLYNHWVAPNGKRFYIGKKCDTETISGVITDEQRLGPVTLDAGLRITGTYLNEYAAFNIEGEGGKFRTVTPVTDEWEPALIQGSVGITYTVTERFSAFVNSAAGNIKPRVGTLLDNKGTEPVHEPLNEIRYKIDIGLLHNFGNAGKMTLTAFGVFQKNAIALSGTTYLDPESNIRRELYLNRNQNQKGIEFEIISPTLMDIIRPFFNITFMQSKMEEDGALVVNKENPVWIANAGIYSVWKSFDINLMGKYVSPFENDRFVSVADGPQPLGDFFVTDLNAGYTTNWKTPVRFYLRSKNLTDKIYSTVNGYPDYGRMVYAGINVIINRLRPQPSVPLCR